MPQTRRTTPVILGTSIGTIVSAAPTGATWVSTGHAAQVFITNVLNQQVTFTLAFTRAGVNYFIRNNEPLEAYQSFPGSIVLFLENGDALRGFSNTASAVHVVVSGIEGTI